MIARIRHETRRPDILPAVFALFALLMAADLSAADFRVERAPEWEQLFYRHSGWTGADGGFSIPLSGVHAQGTGHLGPTIFTYGDTWIGGIDRHGERLPGCTIVNNTFSILPPVTGDPGPMRFIHSKDEWGEPRAVFVPETPNSEPGDWYWPADGFVNRALDGGITLFHYRMREPVFTGVGVSIVVVPPDSPDPAGDHRQYETPLFRAGDSARETIGFGFSLVVNTEWARAPDPDGHIYVYGHEEGLPKNLVVCRIRPEDIENPDAWRFWDGVDWVEDIAESAPLFPAYTGGITVEQLADGRVIALYLDFSGHIKVRIGEGVTGPFGPVQIVYRTPEIDLDPDIFTYNPIAHPHLSEPGELLVNYSVNSFDFWDLFHHAEWYFPKFIRLILEEPVEAGTRE